MNKDTKTVKHLAAELNPKHPNKQMMAMTMDADRAFLFLVHPNHGLLLLYTTRKKSKGPHYQVPGGHVEQEDFDTAVEINRSAGRDDPILAYKICAARELYEETGINLRDSLDRLQPVQLQTAEDDKFPCEYKKRIFFSVQVTDEDMALKDAEGVLTQALDTIPPNVMLNLSEEHQGFMFQRNLSEAVESLTLHSGGKVSTALSMAVENGEVKRLMEAVDDNEVSNGKQVKSIECNSVTLGRLDRSPCKEANAKDCERTYMLYFPQIVCEAGKEDEIGTLPLVFAVHCYGCDSRVVLDAFSPYANTHNVVIVAPNGLQHSFNGLDCCGYALSSKLDDVGFFSEIQSSLEVEYPFINSAYSYAVGWSNGGYMVMYSAQLFRAIAPISGYIMEYPDIKAGTGVFFHHSLDDPFVRSTGCCSDPNMPACCCGIVAEQCVSVHEVMKDIAQSKNGCGYENGEVELKHSFVDEKAGIACLTADSTSCIANTTICQYEHFGHFNGRSFKASFPMAEQVMDFFTKDACGISNGAWDNRKKICECNSGYGGTYCLDPDGDNILELSAASSAMKLPVTTPIHKFTGGILILTFIGMCLLRHKLTSGKSKTGDEVAAEAEERIELVSQPKQSGLSKKKLKTQF